MLDYFIEMVKNITVFIFPPANRGPILHTPEETLERAVKRCGDQMTVSKKKSSFCTCISHMLDNIAHIVDILLHLFIISANKNSSLCHRHVHMFQLWKREA